jgi:hypothetical protein
VAEVARAARHAVACHLVSYHDPGPVRRVQDQVLLYVLHLTLTWTRTEDTIHLPTVADAIGAKPGAVGRALAALNNRGVLVYRSATGPGRLGTIALHAPPAHTGLARIPGDQSDLRVVWPTMRSIALAAAARDIPRAQRHLIMVLLTRQLSWGVLAADERLDDLAAATYLSRSTLRRALHATAARGWLTYTPGDGRQPSRITFTPTAEPTTPAPAPTPTAAASSPDDLDRAHQSEPGTGPATRRPAGSAASEDPPDDTPHPPGSDTPGVPPSNCDHPGSAKAEHQDHSPSPLPSPETSPRASTGPEGIPGGSESNNDNTPAPAVTSHHPAQPVDVTGDLEAVLANLERLLGSRLERTGHAWVRLTRTLHQHLTRGWTPDDLAAALIQGRPLPDPIIHLTGLLAARAERDVPAAPPATNHRTIGYPTPPSFELDALVRRAAGVTELWETFTAPWCERVHRLDDDTWNDLLDETGYRSLYRKALETHPRLDWLDFVIAKRLAVREGRDLDGEWAAAWRSTCLPRYDALAVVAADTDGLDAALDQLAAAGVDPADLDQLHHLAGRRALQQAVANERDRDEQRWAQPANGTA